MLRGGFSLLMLSQRTQCAGPNTHLHGSSTRPPARVVHGRRRQELGASSTRQEPFLSTANGLIKTPFPLQHHRHEEGWPDKSDHCPPCRHRKGAEPLTCGHCNSTSRSNPHFLITSRFTSRCSGQAAAQRPQAPWQLSLSSAMLRSGLFRVAAMTPALIATASGHRLGNAWATHWCNQCSACVTTNRNMTPKLLGGVDALTPPTQHES